MGAWRWVPLACVFGAAAAFGGEVAERRVVVALVEGRDPDPHTEDLVHQVVEMPLNHLGMVVRRHYVDRGPPPDAVLADARAVLLYLPTARKLPGWVWPWLEREVPARDLRVIHFDGVAGLALADPPRFARWLARFGLSWDGWYGEGLAVRAKFRGDALCAFEADPRLRRAHLGPKNRSDGNTVWVETRHRLRPGDARAPVVTGDWGALALHPWTLRKGSAAERRWYLDPFAFFRAALGLDGVPAPHPGVLNGRRMWFLQVDGDGFESLSTIRPNTTCARIMLDDVFRRYRLPYTVSVIVRSLTPDYAVQEPTRAMDLAREILALPHVEPASHGVLHTLEWQQDGDPATGKGRLAWYRQIANYQYSQVNEVADSIRFINERLLDGDRRCRLMLWTGEANPRADAIRAAGAAGAWNLNGGVFRWDTWWDSVGYVSPWSREVDGALQVYAGAANENAFEGFFDTMPGAFANVDETIERTGRRRILKPADIYLHFYSADRPARLASVHALIRRWAYDEETAPVFASTYARAVESAVRTARVRRRPDGWRFADFGACRTARIDGETRNVDWRRSRGLLGARRLDGALYLHLAGPDAAVVLAPDARPRPHVEQANCALSEAELGAARVAVIAEAVHHRVVVFAGFAPGARVAVLVDGEATERAADAAGRIAVDLATPGRSRVVVETR